MEELTKYAVPQKIVWTTSSKIIFKDTNGNLKVLNLNKLSNYLDREAWDIIRNNPDKVKIEANGFFWKGKTDLDEIFLGSDTINDLSDDISVEDFTSLIKILSSRNSKQLKKIVRAVGNVL